MRTTSIALYERAADLADQLNDEGVYQLLESLILANDTEALADMVRVWESELHDRRAN